MGKLFVPAKSCTPAIADLERAQAAGDAHLEATARVQLGVIAQQMSGTLQ